MALELELTVMDVAGLIAVHLLEMLRHLQGQLLTLTSVDHLITRCSKLWPRLVDELQQQFSLAELTALLQELADEDIALAPYEPLLEACCSPTPRTALGGRICAPHLVAGKLPALALEAHFDEVLVKELEQHGWRALEHLLSMLDSLLVEAQAEELYPVLLTSGLVRRKVRELIHRHHPETAVIAWEELPPDLELGVLAEIGLAFHQASNCYPRDSFEVRPG